MAATSGGSGSGEPDMVLVGELLEDIQRHPPAIAARKLLTEHYISVGWLDAAMENATELKKLAPADSDVTGFIAVLSKKPEPPTPTPQSATPTATTPSSIPKPRDPPKPAKKKHTVQLPRDLDSTRQDFTQGYTSLRHRTRTLLADLLHLQALQKKKGLPQSKNIPRFQAIIEGRSDGPTLHSGPPGSARSVARIIQTNADKATELAIADLEDMVKWLREPHGKASGVDDDTVRDHLVKRIHSIESALPEELRYYPEIAFMHVQHENLKKDYVNEETMLGDLVKDIPRGNFWVTEDNYAWDMEELAQAITANGGVMRNPLSRQMFTPKDIRGIVMHPAGKQLAALQVEQGEMAKGVRIETIDQMEKLAKVLLDDQSSDALPSRHAVDEFMAYVATRELCPLFVHRHFYLSYFST
jgi:hypothetical protein